MTLPVVQPLDLSGNEDTDILATLVGSDADSDPLDNFEIVSGPVNGVVVPVPDGGIEEYVYKPNADFSGTDSFTYRVLANGEYSDPQTVTITVNAVSDMPKISQELGPVPGAVSGTLGNGDGTAVAVSPASDWLEVRHGYNQLGDTDGIYFQLFDFDGSPTTSGLVNTTTTDAQFDPAVAALNSGSYVVTWTSANQDGDGNGVYFQKFIASGATWGGETLVNTTTTGHQGSADIAATNNGSFIIVWESSDGIETHINLQRYDTSGGASGGEDVIDSAIGYDGYDPSIAVMASNNYVVTWTSTNLDGSGNGVFARVFSSSGTPVTSQFQVNDATANDQAGSEIVALADDSFVVAYTSFADGIATHVALSRFNQSGDRIGSEIVVPVNGGDAIDVSLLALPDGGFAVGWEQVEGSLSEIWLQRFDQAGVALSAPVQVDAGSTEEQLAPTLAYAMDQLLVMYSEDPVAAGDNPVRHQFFSLTEKVTQLTEGDGTVAYELLPNAVITDPDSTNLVQLTVQIVSGFRDGDVLDVSSAESGLSESFIGDTLTLTGNGALFTYSDILQSLRMTAANGGDGTRVLSIVATAADGSSQAEQLSLTVQTAHQDINGPGTNDVLYGGNGNDTLDGSDGDDTLVGNAAEDRLNGGNGNDSLWGVDGNDTLNGGAGLDTAEGGNGDDVYYVNRGDDVIIEEEGRGNDSVEALSSYTLSDFVEHLLLLGGNADFSGTGNNSNNRLVGNAGDNLLDGGNGFDTLFGRDGDDYLDGGLGGDILSGEAGNDTYVVDGSDTLVEYYNSGFDLVVADGDWTLATHFEDLILTGTGNHAGNGNSVDNYIEGNSGNNTLFGAAGNDYIVAGAGNDKLMGGTGIDTLEGEANDDLYIIDSFSDYVIELNGGGIDTVYTSDDYNLDAYVEHVYFVGEDYFTGTGNGLANRMTGSILDDDLSGGAGYDTLVGDTGDDTLRGGTMLDHIYGGSGNDQIFGDDGNDKLFGGDHLDTIYGGNGQDNIDGGVGADSLFGENNNDFIAGGFGNDSLNGGAGNDTLNGNVDDDTLDGGIGNDMLMGDVGSDMLYGGADSDTLDGAIGADTLFGGDGNDVYKLGSDGTDTVFENAAEGIDTIEVLAISFGIGMANVENLTGMANNGQTLNLSGDGGHNLITGLIVSGSANFLLDGGPGGNDTLVGNVGNDTLFGRDGNDTLVGGGGADTFEFNTLANSVSNRDNIDFEGGIDTIRLDGSYFSQLGQGPLNAANFTIGAAAVDTNDYIVFNDTTGALYYDADANGGGVAVQFAQLTGTFAVAAADITVYLA